MLIELWEKLAAEAPSGVDPDLYWFAFCEGARNGINSIIDKLEGPQLPARRAAIDEAQALLDYTKSRYRN